MKKVAALFMTVLFAGAVALHSAPTRTTTSGCDKKEVSYQTSKTDSTSKTKKDTTRRY